MIRVYGPDSIIVFLWLPHTPNHQGWGSHASFQDSDHNLYSSSRRPSHFSQHKTVHVKEGKCKTVHKPSLISSHCQRCYLSPCCSRRWPPHRQSGHWICFRVVHSSECRVYWCPVLLLHITPDNTKDIFFVPHIPKQIKRTKKWRVWPIQDVQRRIGRDICQRLLFIHAFSGCDTTACPYGMGKGTILSKVMNNLVLGKCADTLTDVNSTREDVIEAGEILLWDSWPVAMALIPWQASAICWLRQRLSLQLVGQKSNTPSGLTIRSWLG